MPSKVLPPPGGVVIAPHQITIALIPAGDYGEITDTPPTARLRQRQQHRCQRVQCELWKRAIRLSRSETWW